MENIMQDYDCDELNESLREDDVVKCMQFLNINKSPCPDGICLDMYIHTLSDSMPFLHNLLKLKMNGVVVLLLQFTRKAV